MSTASVLPFAPAPDLLTEIETRRIARLLRKSTPYARTHPIASDVDPDACVRRQVFEIVAWQDKPLFSAQSNARMEVGTLHEDQAVINLIRDGFEVIAQQTPFELRHRKTQVIALRGKIDGKIRWHGEEVPFEIKTMDPNVYARVNTLGDLLTFWWTKKYIAQLMSYLIGHGHKWGFFYLTDLKGNWKAIRVELDYEMAERIWAYAESIVDAVTENLASKALPAYSNDPKECEKCSFFKRTCQPDIVEQGAAMMEDPELAAKLDRWDLIREIGKEFADLDKEVKAAIKSVELPTGKGIVGDFAVVTSKRNVKAYEVKARVDTIVSISRLLPASPSAVAAHQGAQVIRDITAALQKEGL